MCIARLILQTQRALTAKLHSDEVLEALVLQEHSRRSAGLEVKGDVRRQLCLQGGEVQVRRLLVERGCVPDRPWRDRRKRKERKDDEVKGGGGERRSCVTLHLEDIFESVISTRQQVFSQSST